MMPCFLYLYDSNIGKILELIDVTNASTDERELRRIELLIKCQFPCDVMESNIFIGAAARPASNMPIISHENPRCIRTGAG